MHFDRLNRLFRYRTKLLANDTFSTLSVHDAEPPVDGCEPDRCFLFFDKRQQWNGEVRAHFLTDPAVVIASPVLELEMGREKALDTRPRTRDPDYAVGAAPYAVKAPDAAPEKARLVRDTGRTQEGGIGFASRHGEDGASGRSGKEEGPFLEKPAPPVVHTLSSRGSGSV